MPEELEALRREKDALRQEITRLRQELESALVVANLVGLDPSDLVERCVGLETQIIRLTGERDAALVDLRRLQQDQQALKNFLGPELERIAEGLQRRVAVVEEHGERLKSIANGVSAMAEVARNPEVTPPEPKGEEYHA